MKLNVIIPTYNRAKLLAETLQSVENARIPSDLEIEVIIVNNNSNDNTDKIIKDYQEKAKNKLVTYLIELKQGRSSAVNTGIRHSNCDLITMIDDDIRIEKDWFERVEEIFRERWDEVDFVGGKVLPIFETTPPEWVITIRDVGICWRDYGEDEWQYNQNTPILTGGHAVLKSEIFEEVGFYPEDLGVMKKNLASCEDEVMFDKLILAGKRGFYSPKMVVHHFVPTRRVTKNFFRQWYFGAGKSWNVVEENHKPFLGAKIFRVPRYMYRDALLSSWRKFKAVIQRDEIESLRAEKEILLFLGFFYGRNIAGSKLDNPLKKITEISIQIAER